MWNIFGLLLAVAVRRHRRRSARLALPLRLFSVEDIRPKIAYILMQTGKGIGIHAAALIRDLGNLVEIAPHLSQSRYQLLSLLTVAPRTGRVD